MRVTFDTVFIQHTDGSLEPKQRIRVGGVTFSPGVHFSRGVVFAGIDFFSPQVFGHDFEINTEGDIIVIVGVY